MLACQSKVRKFIPGVNIVQTAPCEALAIWTMFYPNGDWELVCDYHKPETKKMVFLRIGNA